MRFEVQTDVPEQWDRFVEDHPKGSIYHSSAWLRAICDFYRYQLLFVLRRSGSSILAGIPLARVDSWLTGRRLVAFPFSDSCEPLLGAGERLDNLFKAVADEGRLWRADYVEIRDFQPTGEEAAEAGYLNHRLNLDRAAEELWTSLHHDCVRRRVMKAKRLGVRCERARGDTPENVEKFYRLHARTRQRQGVPVQPFGFFKALFRAMSSSGRMELIFATYSARRVAAIVVLYFEDVAYYKFGASEDRFNWTGANQLLMWQAIQNAQSRDARVFDFGRTSVRNKGLRDYKRRWGTTERPLYYLEIPAAGRSQCLIETSPRHALIKGFLRRIPLWANGLVGKCLYRHFG